MRRRECIVLIGGAAAWPLAVCAQQGATPVIGFLHVSAAEERRPLLAGFLHGLKEVGYTEGQNVIVEYRWAGGNFNQLPALARDLVQRQVNVIAALGGTFVGLAAKRATSTIPIVFVATGDPVGHGLVASLNRPGGNVTGVVLLAVELLGKRVELLLELTPNGTKIGALMNPTNPSRDVQLAELENAARSLGRQIIISDASSDRELDSAFVSLTERQARAILISSDPFWREHNEPSRDLLVRN